MTPEDKAEIKRLWTETPMSGSQIAARFGVTKNVVLGHASRNRWVKFGTDRRRGTMDRRLDAVWAAMKKVHNETEIVLKADRAKWRQREADRLREKRGIA